MNETLLDFDSFWSFALEGLCYMERNYAIDYFKFWAIFFVVCIHTAPFKGTVLFGIDGDNVNLIINTFARFGVPFFFVVSGFLFGQKILSMRNRKKYFRNYFKKIIKLFISWYLFYVIYGMILNVIEAFVYGWDIKQEIASYLNSFIGVEKFLLFIMYGSEGGPASYHLWYLSALIWSILVIYIFIRLDRLGLLLFISLFLNMVGLFGQTYSGIFNLELFDQEIKTRDAIFFGLFYTTLGCYIAFNYNLIIEKISTVRSDMIVRLFIFFSFLQIGERVIAHKFWPEEIRATDFYISTIFIAVCLIFFVIKNGSIGENSIISKIGKNAVGIYVSHTMFINLTYFILNLLEIDIKKSLMFHLIFTPLIFITSYVFYNSLQLIKMKLRFMFYDRDVLDESRVKKAS